MLELELESFMNYTDVKYSQRKEWLRMNTTNVTIMNSIDVILIDGKQNTNESDDSNLLKSCRS